MGASETLPDSPSDSPLGLEDVMTSPTYRSLLDPESHCPSAEHVRLADLAGTPVALVFGSYT